MNTLRVCFCSVVVLFATAASSAPITEHVLVPVADGAIFDQGPFDGIGDPDGILDGQSVTVFLNSRILDSRGVVEFDLTQIPTGKRIQSATLRLVPRGMSFLPGTTIAPIQVMGYRGDGTLDVGDFNEGTFLTVYDGLEAPNDSVVEIDVTAFTQLLHRRHRHYVGFSFRTNVHGFMRNYGSLDIGSPVTLIVVQ